MTKNKVGMLLGSIGGATLAAKTGVIALSIFLALFAIYLGIVIIKELK